MRCAIVLLGLCLGVGMAGCGGPGPSQGGCDLAPRPVPAARVAEHAESGSWAADASVTGERSRVEPVAASEPSMVADAVGKAELHLEVTVRPPRPAEPPRWSDTDPRRSRSPEPPAGLDRSIQSGTLTAGSFDDVLNFDDYRQFVATAMARDPRELLPRLGIQRRAMIEVVTPQGMPVGGARVTVRAAANRQAGAVLATLITGSDGRTMFVPELDGSTAGRDYLVTVQRDGASQERLVHLDQGPWRVDLPEVQPELPRRLDLALVVDTTGSMSDELEYLKVEIDSIAQSIYRMFPQVDQRYALVLYRDAGDEYVVRPLDFTASLAKFRERLAEQSANGGGDEPEAVHLAMEQAVQLDWRDGNTARVLFHVADAPPHAAHGRRTVAAVNQLRARGVRIYPVASSGVGTHAEFTMRGSAFLTLGQYLFLTDHSGVGNPHAVPHVPQYAVERLDRLMVRMIASELAGRRLMAEEILAIESGGQAAPEPQVALAGCPQRGARRTASAVFPSTPSAHMESTGWMPHPYLVLAVLLCGALIVDRLSRA